MYMDSPTLVQSVVIWLPLHSSNTAKGNNSATLACLVRHDYSLTLLTCTQPALYWLSVGPPLAAPNPITLLHSQLASCTTWLGTHLFLQGPFSTTQAVLVKATAHRAPRFGEKRPVGKVALLVGIST